MKTVTARQVWFIFALVALALFSGCDMLAITDTPAAPLDFPTITPTVEVTTTATEYTGECAFVWSNRSLPEVSVVLNTAFQEAGFTEVEVEAVAYGENCINPATNSVVRFAAMQTDIFAQVRVPDATDGQAMGDWIERITSVLNGLPPETLPGPNRGYIGITFQSDQGTANLWFPRSKTDELLNQGMRGSQLYEALRGP